MTSDGSVFFLGTAGSGKTVLSAVMRRYLQSQTPDNTIINVNLDPAVQNLPYTCEVDVRDYVDIQALVDMYELGPNGAMVHANDVIATSFHEIKEDIDDWDADAVLIDTPGQLEIFVYRTAGPIITSMFDKDSTCAIFLFDANIVKHASSWISLNLLASSVQFRLQLPMIYALSKVDLLEKGDLKRIMRWADDVDFVVSDMTGMDSPMLQDLALSIAGTMQELQNQTELVPYSSLEEIGIRDIAAFLSRIWTKGDDWTI
jgi:GTPase SAR1 family protein